MAKVLVVDDDTDILEVMSAILKSHGHEVETRARGEGTLERVHTFRPDIVLLDIWLSGTNGLDICARLKATGPTRNIPVLIFSAHPKASEKIASSGADAFLSKPFEVSELLEKINLLLSVR